jgi:hypothetical protein
MAQTPSRIQTSRDEPRSKRLGNNLSFFDLTHGVLVGPMTRSAAAPVVSTLQLEFRNQMGVGLLFCTGNVVSRRNPRNLSCAAASGSGRGRTLIPPLPPL